MGVIQGNVFINSYPTLVKLDNDLIPDELKHIVNNQKKMETQLFQVQNIRFRNSIIGFARKLAINP